ncbi:MAG: chloride channel protein [Polyangiales bacterium]|nr:chloride channel protein [Myxococcales bacterium]
MPNGLVAMPDPVPQPLARPPQPAPGSEGTAASARLVLGTLLVATAAAAFAIVFRAALAYVHHRAFNAPDVVVAISGLPGWARVLLPAVGGLLGGVLGRLAMRQAGGHGVGDVMEAVVLGRVRLSMRVTLLKSAASWLAIVTGGSLGREGPLIQFGGSAGTLISERLGLTTDHARILIAAGTAAGFGAAYNTPFAAVLFVLEVVAGVVVIDVVVPTLVATVVACAITRAVLGDAPLYGVRTFHIASSLELVLFVGLGALCAVGAQAFMRTLTAGERWFHRGWLPYPWRPAAGGALAGLVLVALPSVAGNGYEPLSTLLDGGFPVGLVAMLIVGKLLATTASVSSGSPGGVFTPTLLIGGALGALYAELLTRANLTTSDVGGYALVGMAAATAATTHAPLMAAVMVFELSADYALALPLILATAVATIISRRMRRASIYTAELHARGIAWEFTMDGRRT